MYDVCICACIHLGETPLHIACIWGNTEILRSLLALSQLEDVNFRAFGPKSLDMTPLTWNVIFKLNLAN